ncbi:MAG: UDP-N-acetylmuramate--L-alanine ligase [Clostridiales bacterium]|nr:UDP-N-acetylmuramate--L-alanine ligase [Clostridiales bacterium]
MCPLAEILHSKGYDLTGSDNNETDTLQRIKNLGIPVYMGQRAENIKGAEMIVYTAAILPDNPELVAAKSSGIPTFERSKLLGAVSRKFGCCIGISGTHGKTTTTSMTAQILINAGMDPSAVIGGKLPMTGTNGITGKSDIFLCEACEFSNTFLELSPKCSVILNVDADHMEFFKTMDNLEASFVKFANMAETVIYNGDDANTLTVMKSVKNKKTVTFGFNKSNDWYPDNIQMDNGAYPEFDVFFKGKKQGRAVLSVPGKHNIYNALAAVASAVYAGCEAEQAIELLHDFRGAGRRFEVLGTYKGITIADDYAHHPAELKVTLDAAKQMDYKRVIAVFQPFTYSRTAMLLDDFARVLTIPDKTIMTEIMGSREINTYNIYTKDLAKKIPGSEWYPTFRQVADRVEELAREGDLVITLGCGDVYKIAKTVAEDLRLD